MDNQIKNRAFFELVYKEYYNPLVNYINKKTSNLDTSKEIVQIVFSKLWSKRETLEINSSIKSYLYRSVNNAFYDYYKSRAAMRSNVDAEGLDEIPNETESVLDPYLIRAAIEQALLTLKEKNRIIFKLNKFEGLTYKEIANHLEISERAVEDNIARAMKALKVILKEKDIY